MQPPATHCPLPRGGSVHVTYDDCNFKQRYVDEYTGEELPRDLVKAAMIEDMRYFNSKVWHECGVREAGTRPIRVRWVICNKGDSLNPDIRARLVACELGGARRRRSPSPPLRRLRP